MVQEGKERHTHFGLFFAGELHNLLLVGVQHSHNLVQDDLATRRNGHALLFQVVVEDDRIHVFAVLDVIHGKKIMMQGCVLFMTILEQHAFFLFIKGKRQEWLETL
jgi:hypothetical protein